MNVPLDSPADPAARPTTARSNRHLLIRTAEGLHFIVSATILRDDVALIQIDPYSGTLLFLGVPNVDLFASVRLARDSLEQRGHRITEETEMEALVGYIVVQQEGYLLGVTQSREEVTLPGGAVLRTVLRTVVLRLPLHTAASATSSSRASPLPADTPELLPAPIAAPASAPPHQPSAADLLAGVFDYAYFYCETTDATAHFPTLRTHQNFESEFCWNEWLTTSFERAGLQHLPVALLHGSVGWRLCGSTNLALVTRKSRVNVTMGSQTSGLNLQHGVSNDWEYELLAWGLREAESLSMASYVWRAGVVPVWWRADYTRKAEQRVQMTSAEPLLGSDVYFARLAARHDTSGGLVLVSLLGSATHESLLAAVYRDAVAHVRRRLSLPISVIELDWTRAAKELGPADAVGRFWEQLHPLLKGSSLSVCVLAARSIGAAASFRVLSRQTALVRFNSFDGTERAPTAMTCFAFQVAAELTAMVSGRGGAGWAGLRGTFEKVTSAVEAPLLEAVVHWFAYKAQLVGWYYGLPAPKQPFMLAQLAAAGAYAPAEALLAYQRAGAGERGCQPEQLAAALGQHRDAVNALAEPHAALVSQYPAWAVVPLPPAATWPAALPAPALPFAASSPLAGPAPLRPLAAALPPAVLSVPLSSAALCAATERADFLWSRVDCNVAELTVFLREPCIVTELVLHVPDRLPPGAYPQLLDVCCGDYLDRMDVIFQSIALPRLESGGRLHYKFPNAAESRMFNHLYKFEPLTFPFQRVVQLSFRGASGRMVLGRVDVLGIPARPNASRLTSLHEMHQQKVKEQVEQLLTSFAAARPSEPEASSSSSPALAGGPSAVILPSYPSIDRLPSERQHSKQQQQQKSALSLRSVEQPVTLNEGLVSPRDLVPAERQYIEFIQRKFAPQLSLLDALKIDLLRLQLQLTPQQRNMVLLRLGLHIDAFNPSTYVYHHDEKLETYKRKLDKWKTTRCSAESCQAALGFLRRSAYQCAYCYRFFCHSCMSSVSKRILEFMWTQPQPVCKGCCSVLSEQEDILCEIQGLVVLSLAIEKRKESAAIAHQMVLSDVQCAHEPAAQQYAESWRSLAQFPTAGILTSVPTHPQSAPVESILFPPQVAPPHTGHWCAPAGVRSVNIVVVLAAHCAVHKMALLVDALGYSVADVPIIRICAGFTAKQSRMVDFWPLPSSGPIAPGEWLEFAFKQPFECRLLTLSLVLPEDDKTTGRLLHLGRIFVSGQALAPRLEESLHADLLLSPAGSGAEGPSNQRVKLVPQEQQFRPAQRMLDLQLRPGAVVAGFSIAPLPAAGWPRIVHVTALRSRNESDSLRQLGRFHIPRAQPPVPLVFYFASPQEVAQISIEFAASYGTAHLLAPPRVDLFAALPSG